MPKYNNPRKTWQYSSEFKVKALQLSLISGIQVQYVANTPTFIRSCCHDGVTDPHNLGACISTTEYNWAIGAGDERQWPGHTTFNARAL